jgi:hypothetical protein
MICGLVGCGQIPYEKRFVMIDKYLTHHGYVVYLVYDPETKVEYFMRGDLMCPHYDENGNISFYGGD